MKKWLCLLITVFVFASVSTVMAEEAQELSTGEVQEAENPVDSDFAYVPFGLSADTPAASIQELWEQNSDVVFSGDPVWDEKTLSSGTRYKEMTLTGESSYGFQLEAKYYYNSDGMLIAGTQVYTSSNEANGPAPRETLIRSFGNPVPLRLESIGDFAELFGESFHLEEGQDMWKYKTWLRIPDATVEAGAILTMKNIDGRVYLAAFLDPEAGRKTAVGSINLEDLQGYKDLTPEQKQAVDMYAEYLDSQLKENLEKYINFLQTKK